MKTYKEIIEKKLDEYIEIKYPQKLYESMKYSVNAKGKRLRPILCLETCRLFSGDYSAALPTACAIEMLHVQTLIHDDLPSMDNDDFRRGIPTNHKVFGEAVAVLSGDALLSFAPEIILKKSDLPAQTILKVLEQFFNYAGANGVIAGQIVDIESEHGNSFDEKTLNFIHSHKTADLFKLPLKTGAIIGGASDEQIQAIEEFAQNLGFAFQILDDILDETSTFEEMGKTIGKDENAQKLTYTRLFGLDKAKCEVNCLLDNAYAILEHNGWKSELFDEIISSIRERALIQK